MSDTRTLGEHAYATYAHLLHTQWPMATWQGLTRLERYAWEDAAQAVLAQGTRRWTAEDIVQQINAREAASLEELRREAEDAP